MGINVKKILALFEDPHPDDSIYDPVHLGVVSVGCLVVIGLLYWLLWTFLVYEGGLFSKIAALFSSDRSADVFEGWFGNTAALLILIGLIAALHRLYNKAALRHAKGSTR